MLSYQALSGLVELAKMRSAHPVLLMTWGYLEGDKQEHPTIFPDYHAMQVICFIELHKLSLFNNSSYMPFSNGPTSEQADGIASNSCLNRLDNEVCTSGMQERLANGYLSLATRIQQDFNISSLLAPAGLAWQHIYKLLHNLDAAELPAGTRVMTLPLKTSL